MTRVARPGGDHPSISVVIAVWDAYCTLLPEALDSALSQEDVDVEAIVVDNASTVALPDLPEGVTVLRSAERLSAGAARNLALAHLSAPAVLFLDADDVLLPGALGHLHALLRGHPGAVAAVCKRVLWHPDTGIQRVNERSPRPLVYRLSRHRRTFAALTLRYDVFQLTGCALLDRDAARDAGGFGDASLAEDWMLRSALTARGRIVFGREGVVRFRVHDSLWHREHSRAELDDAYATFRAHRSRDSRLPLWARAAMPLVAAGHRHDVRKLTAGGAYRPIEPGIPRG
ncbi:MAG: glycosyltransferase family 2 protein [Solirubrobacteraceae bacterium]|jgi:glycosyltransferase involved in cell wall biosynthesis